MVSSSDEDTSDEAFAARHAALEAEEQQRFNTLAGKSLKFWSVYSIVTLPAQNTIAVTPDW